MITDDGQQYIVQTSKLTRFGTTIHAMPPARFLVGTRALVIGWETGDTIIASRVSPPDWSSS